MSYCMYMYTRKPLRILQICYYTPKYYSFPGIYVTSVCKSCIHESLEYQPFEILAREINAIWYFGLGMSQFSLGMSQIGLAGSEPDWSGS